MKTKTQLKVVRDPAEQAVPAVRRMIPAKDWEKHHAWPTLKALRNYIFRGAEIGADVWIVRVGRTVLVDEAKFFEWASTVGDRARAKWSKPKPKPADLAAETAETVDGAA